MARAKFDLAFKKELLPTMLELGFTRVKNPDYSRYYARTTDGIEEAINIWFMRFTPTFDLELIRDGRNPRTVSLRSLSYEGMKRALQGWNYETEENLLAGLREARQLLLNEGLRWLSGDLDFWEFWRSIHGRPEDDPAAQSHRENGESHGR